MRQRRRRVVRWGAVLGVQLLAAACVPSSAGPQVAQQTGTFRLEARPGTPVQTATPGESALGLSSGRDGLLYVPEGYDAASPVPLMVVLHGAGGDADNWRGLFVRADEEGFAVLSVDSRGRTWDRILGGFGPDVEFLDRALRHTFDRVAVDPEHVALAGFSDGASYALSLGVSNGALFSHLVIHSPGYYLPGDRSARKPPVWISHGTQDGILPFEGARDRIAAGLEDEGYDVTFREFVGGHTIPAEIAREGRDWFLGR